MGAGPDDLIGEVLLDKLKVLRVLGTGGMGAVYEVEHLITKHRRALKIVHDAAGASEETVERFLREASVAGTVDSPHVVETYDAGTLADGSPYALMELLEGVTLFDLITAHGRLEPGIVCELVAQVCEGLAAAHAKGIIHRDLKPENIFVLRERSGPRVKLIDFGISKFTAELARLTPLTQEGTIVGTPYYMSPEMARGGEVDPRTDVYALGVIMYEAVTGQVPYQATAWPDLAIQIHEGKAKPLREVVADVDRRFELVVAKAMHKRPDKRYQSADKLRDAVRALADPDALMRMTTSVEAVSRDAETLTAGVPARPASKSRLRPGAALLVAGGIALAAGVGWILWGMPESPAPGPAVASPPPAVAAGDDEPAPLATAPSEQEEPAEEAEPRRAAAPEQQAEPAPEAAAAAGPEPRAGPAHPSAAEDRRPAPSEDPERVRPAPPRGRELGLDRDSPYR